MRHRYSITLFVDSTDTDPRRVQTDVNIYMNASIVSELGNIKYVCKIKAHKCTNNKNK